MKRSEINAVIKKFEALMKEHCFELPPYLGFTPEEWIRDMNMMRYGITCWDGM